MSININDKINFVGSKTYSDAINNYTPGYIYFTNDNNSSIIVNNKIYGTTNSDYMSAPTGGELGSYIISNINNSYNKINDTIKENELILAHALNYVNHKKIIQIDKDSLINALLPNVKYVCNVPLTNINCYFENSEELVETYTIMFKSADSGCTLNLPNYIYWQNNQQPTLKSSKLYEITITKTKIAGVSYYKGCIMEF